MEMHEITLGHIIWGVFVVEENSAYLLVKYCKPLGLIQDKLNQMAHVFLTVPNTLHQFSALTQHHYSFIAVASSPIMLVPIPANTTHFTSALVEI